MSPEMESTFDADAFMAGESDTTLDTRFTPFDEGEYTVILGEDIRAKAGKESDSGRPTVLVTVPYNILDEEVKEKLDMENPTLFDMLFVELNEDGSIASGPNKNVKLGALRAALNQNVSGQPWNFNMLKGGGPIRIYVTKRPDKEDPTIIYNRVQRFAPMRAA